MCACQTKSHLPSYYQNQPQRDTALNMSFINSTSSQRNQVASILILCICWYIVSSSNNVIGKLVLNEFPYPMTVTMVQLSSITIYSGPFFNFWGVRKYVDISWPYYIKLIVPLALGKFLASVTSHISIWKVPVSYAHTGKNVVAIYKCEFSHFRSRVHLCKMCVCACIVC